MLADQEEPSRRHAGSRTVEPQSEGQRRNRTIQIGAGQHEDSIAAGELHDSGRQMRRQLMQNRRASGGGAGEKNFVHAGSDGLRRRLGRFVQQLQQSRIEAATHQHVAQRLSGGHAASRRLPQNGIAGGQRLQRLHPGQEQRIVRGRNNEHHTQRLAPGLRGDPAKPKGAGVRAKPLGSKNPAGFALQKTAGLDQRQHLRDQGVGHTAMQCAGLVAGNTLRNFLSGCGDAMPGAAQQGEALAQALLRPDLLRRPRLPQGGGDGPRTRARSSAA